MSQSHNLKFRALRTGTPGPDKVTVPRAVPVGREPQAVRIIRPGHPPVVLALVKTREYLLGRSEQADLYFDAETVSVKHGSLYFLEKDSAWVYRDLGSTHRSFASRPDGHTSLVVPGFPIGLIAGYSVELPSGSRVEFLAEVPPDAIGLQSTHVWKSDAGNRLEQALALAAGHTLPIVLIGPSGSGKTFAAKLIHQLSKRPGHFVSINCGHLPHDRVHLGSELIGHVKGAFTGAYEPRQGKLFAADKGTLFLDEVDSLVPEAQAFLLTLLEGGDELVPVGAPVSKRRPRPDFRIICASKRGLKQSGIRPDLSERLGGDFVHLPRLEDRRGDIPVLVERFLNVVGAEVQAHAELSQDALVFLMSRLWPGQVRELQESLQAVAHRRLGELKRDDIATRSFVLGRLDFERYFEDRIKAMDGDGSSGISPTEKLQYSKRPKHLTREDLENALRATNGNKTHAAKRLAIALNTLKRKMKQLGLLSRGRSETG